MAGNTGNKRRKAAAQSGGGAGRGPGNGAKKFSVDWPRRVADADLMRGLAEIQLAKHTDLDALFLKSGVWFLGCTHPDPERANVVEFDIEKPPKSKLLRGLLYARAMEFLEQIHTDTLRESNGKLVPKWRIMPPFSLSKVIKKAIRRQRRTGGALTVYIPDWDNAPMKGDAERLKKFGLSSW